MLDKVAKVEGRYEELTRLLQDPAVLEDQARLVAVAREHREIEQVVEAYRTLRGVEQELADNKEIIAAGEDPELAELAKEELPELEKKRDELAERIKLLLLPKDPNDNKNVLVEIRAGTGGDEAALFAGDLCRMYSRYSEGRGWRVEVVSMSEGTTGASKRQSCWSPEGACTRRSSSSRVFTGFSAYQRPRARGVFTLRRRQWPFYPRRNRASSTFATKISESILIGPLVPAVSTSIRPIQPFALRTFPA
ncbi:uncharacterized protein METZ01_LOCUS437433, partial [marine metagenome]